MGIGDTFFFRTSLFQFLYLSSFPVAFPPVRPTPYRLLGTKLPPDPSYVPEPARDATA